MNELRGLWRGKRLDNGEWAEGYYSPAYVPLMGKLSDFINIGGYTAAEVIPETLGECTGLTDKNGKFIFKGDIVEVRGEDCFAVVGWGENTARFVLNFVCADEISDFDSYCGYECEIIGNIHDNPELLQPNKT